MKNIINLCKFAVNENDHNKFRKYNELNKSDHRDIFEIDRDRIMYSKSFRRLRGKTQVFIAGWDDHVRNRLTHTLEVAQIATSIARRLRLNEMLTEAIALGHDLGHTPFGHSGEEILKFLTNGNNKIVKDCGIELEKSMRGFKHNLQSLRIVDDLELKTRKYPGLNLTTYTKWGILNHTEIKKYDFYNKYINFKFNESDDETVHDLSEL